MARKLGAPYVSIFVSPRSVEPVRSVTLVDAAGRFENDDKSLAADLHAVVWNVDSSVVGSQRRMWDLSPARFASLP